MAARRRGFFCLYDNGFGVCCKMKKMYEQASLGELWHLSYPLIITMAAQVIMQFADRMFLAWYSHEALAACVPAGALAMTFSSLFMGLASYTSVFISQFYAKKKYSPTLERGRKQI